ncbi:MAG: hypothetical protein Q9222_002852 [Ikaeria aurantiellina]
MVGHKHRRPYIIHYLHPLDFAHLELSAWHYQKPYVSPEHYHGIPLLNRFLCGKLLTHLQSPRLDIVPHQPSILPNLPHSHVANSTASWSLSFYPQPLLNYRRRSTAGTTPAFPFINTLGFISYLTSTLLFYASPLIRQQYADRNPSAPNPTVRFNDVVFTVHAVIISSFTWSMFSPRIWGFSQSSQGVPKVIWGIAIGCILSTFILVAFVASTPGGGYDSASWAWIDVAYGISYLKLLITVIKYIPQAYTNYQMKSTKGWSIGQILLDLIGGVLSVAQVVLDSMLEGDWSGVTGNPVKFGLGNVSVVFDGVFMLQHYVLYRKRGDGTGYEEAEAGWAGEDDERRRLLDHRD